MAAELKRGTRVRTLDTIQMLRLAPDFPGWGADDYRKFLLKVEDGSTGTITSVNHHGSNPWTRYCIRLDDGSRLIDAVPARDFYVIAD